jgi:dienelactone hydrolase
MNVLAMVREEFNVDEHRIYLMGHSQGGGGARHIAEKYPGIWAGVALLAPALFDVELTAESKLLDIPVMLAVGDQDTLAEGTKNFSERLAALNADTVEYKLYEGLDHGTIILGSMPEVFRFFGEHSQQAGASAPSPTDIEAMHNAMPDTPGTGSFPAIKESDPGLPGQVIYRPADLSALGNTRLGVYAFGNGSCTDDAAHTRLHLLEVASHGYLVIVPGAIYSGPGAIERPADLPPAGPNAVLTTHEQLGQAITWALAENTRADSAYYGLIDPTAIAVSGFSCGGLQALFNAADPRVATVVMMNSGLFPEGPTTMAGMTGDKSLLQTLHSPILYVLGGETDIAHAAGMDDFAHIDHVPAAVANIDKGHGGTYWEADGGPAAQVVVQWLNWQLRGDAAAGRMFLGENCGLCLDPAWSLETKGMD